MSKAMSKAIDRAFAEWYKAHGIDDPMNGDYGKDVLEYVANKVGMSVQELEWYLE